MCALLCVLCCVCAVSCVWSSLCAVCAVCVVYVCVLGAACTVLCCAVLCCAVQCVCAVCGGVCCVCCVRECWVCAGGGAFVCAIQFFKSQTAWDLGHQDLALDLGHQDLVLAFCCNGVVPFPLPFPLAFFSCASLLGISCKDRFGQCSLCSGLWDNLIHVLDHILHVLCLVGCERGVMAMPEPLCLVGCEWGVMALPEPGGVSRGSPGSSHPC